MMTMSSGRTTTQALISAPLAPALCAKAPGKWKPTVSPPPIAAECLRKVLREDANLVVIVPPLRLHRFLRAARRLRHGVDRLADARVRAAAADVRHGVVDVLVGRARVLAQQRDRRHHLAALAVAALRHLVLDPGLLHRVQLAVLR